MVRHFTLSVVSLTNANLRGADRTQVVLAEVDLTGAQYNEDDLPAQADPKWSPSFHHKITWSRESTSDEKTNTGRDTAH